MINYRNFKITLAFVAIMLTSSGYSKPTPVQFSRDLNSLVNVLEAVHPKPWRHQIKQQFRDGLTRNPDLLTTYPVGPWLTISRALRSLDPQHQDSVTGVNLFNQQYTWSLLPVTFGFFEEGIFIIDAEQDWQHLAGKKVQKINGVDASRLYNRLGAYFPSHQQGWVLQYLRITSILRYLGAPCTQLCTIELMDASTDKAIAWSKDDGLITDNHFQRQIKPVHLVTSFRNNQPQQQAIERQFLSQLSPETIYWNLAGKSVSSTLQYNETEKFVVAYLRNKLINNIILDLRAIAQTDPTLVERLWSLIRKIPDENAHRVIYVIIDGSTSPLVYNLISRLNEMPEVTFVGESTGLQLSHFYDPKVVTLNKTQLTLSIATRHIKMGQGNTPFKPSHRISWHAYDYFSGNDSVLLAIQDLIEINAPD